MFSSVLTSMSYPFAEYFLISARGTLAHDFRICQIYRAPMFPATEEKKKLHVVFLFVVLKSVFHASF